MLPLVVIVGPTATGKSRLAIKLARESGGEVVSADSRQVYRYMDIGTAKPTPQELATVPHHLISIIDPDEGFSLAQYQGLAVKAISDIQGRGRLPLLVGGSGLYVWAVVEGWEIPRVAPEPELRRRLEEQAATGGAEELYRKLLEMDPESAQRIDPRNVRRVIRALEIRESTSRPSPLPLKRAPPWDTLIIGLTAERTELYRRVDERVGEMVKMGLVEEVKRLLSLGYSPELPALSGIGYRQVVRYLRGELPLEEAIKQIKFETHRFVRHQYNWFRASDKRIHWFDIGKPFEEEVRSLVGRFLRGGVSEVAEVVL